MIDDYNIQNFSNIVLIEIVSCNFGNRVLTRVKLAK